MTRAWHCSAGAALLAIVLAAGSARADRAADLQVAQALYNAAVKEMIAKDYAAACPKLEEAARLVPEGIGVRLTLASCYEGLGRLASASATYQIAESLAARERKAEFQRTARDKAAALAPRLATLRIVVSDEVRALPGLEIRRGGSLVGAAQWGLQLPADKGKHVLVVTAGDGRKWEASATIEQDATQVDLRVELPKAEPQATPAAPSPPTPPPPPPAAAPMHPRRIAGIAVGATGLAAVVAGAALGVVAIVEKNRSNAVGFCNGTNHCSNEGADLRWASLRAGNWSTAMLIGGGVALAGGVVLFATAPAGEKKPEAEKAPAAASLVLGPRGLAVTGAW